MVKALILAALVALSACTTTRGGSFCDVTKPLRLSPDVIGTLSDAEVADVLALNEKGRALCGWKT
jgi:hypothetical protein